MYTTPKKAAASRLRAHPYLSPLITPLNKIFGFRDTSTVSSPPSPGGQSLPFNSPFDPLSETPTPRKRYCPPGGDPYSPSPRLVRPKLAHRVGVRDVQSQNALRKQRSFRSLEKPQFNSLPTRRPNGPGFDEISAALEAAKHSSHFPLDKEAEITCNEMGKLRTHRFQATTLTMERERVDRAAQCAPRLQTELEERREVRRRLEADLTKERKRLRAMDKSKVQAAKLAKSKPLPRRQEKRAERRRREAESETDLSADQSPLVEAMEGLRTSVPVSQPSPVPQNPPHRSTTPTPTPTIQPDHAQEQAAEAERVRVAAEFEEALKREEARLLALQQERARAEEEAALYEKQQARIRAQQESQLRREREALLEEERQSRMRAEQAVRERWEQEEALRAAMEARALEELQAEQKAEERARRMDELEASYRRRQEDYCHIQEAHARAEHEANVLRSSTDRAADILRAQEERIVKIAQLEEQFKAQFEAVQSALLAQYYAQYQFDQQQQQQQQQFHQQQRQDSPPPPTQRYRQASLNDIPMRDPSIYVDMDASMHSIPASERPSPPPPSPPRPPTVAERFELYELKWKILKSESPLVAFEQIPWPVLIDVKGPEDVTTALVKEFVMHPDRPGCAGKNQKERVRMDLLLWHPDKCQSRLVEKVPADFQDMTSETVKKIVRILFELKK